MSFFALPKWALGEIQYFELYLRWHQSKLNILSFTHSGIG